MQFDGFYFLSTFVPLLEYLPVTLLVSVEVVVLAFVLGVILSSFTLSRFNLLNLISSIYRSIFRSIPAVALIFLSYYGLPQIFPVLKGVVAEQMVVLSLGAKYAAYMAETFRSAVQSVDRGQLEAASTLHIPERKYLLKVMLPQTAVNALPAFGNYVTGILKESSLVFVIGVTDLFGEGKLLAGASFKYLEVYTAVAIIYWTIVSLYSLFQSVLEEYLGRYEVSS
ncbi:amino acid ABC transporter permease [Fructobacillus sp. W13]|uniref:Amino acid ABC transporter permease n=1 Tax=Fructobacillus apis TaxID=2935017 RepID=A0ABT0ZPF1_9LACO|nr:amino acid ABC transporter permease [Fructobacillus apis]MCO0831873.1 amino acid ABC transporter permease [Fructobacillus apis]